MPFVAKDNLDKIIELSKSEIRDNFGLDTHGAERTVRAMELIVKGELESV
jgi:hypothetical protein